jgi:hypothetical protein
MCFSGNQIAYDAVENSELSLKGMPYRDFYEGRQGIPGGKIPKTPLGDDDIEQGRTEIES